MSIDFTPIFRTPITDVAGCLINFQQQKRCRDFEMTFVECMEAYGIPRGYQKCSDKYEDYHECVTRAKQRERVDIMLRERDSQIKAGTIKKPFSEPPKEDSY